MGLTVTTYHHCAHITTNFPCEYRRGKLANFPFPIPCYLAAETLPDLASSSNQGRWKDKRSARRVLCAAAAAAIVGRPPYVRESASIPRCCRATAGLRRLRLFPTRSLLFSTRGVLCLLVKAHAPFVLIGHRFMLRQAAVLRRIANRDDSGKLLSIDQCALPTEHVMPFGVLNCITMLYSNLAVTSALFSGTMGACRGSAAARGGIDTTFPVWISKCKQRQFYGSSLIYFGGTEACIA